MQKKALLVGIDTYRSGKNLRACAADALAMEKVLARHKNQERNFECIVCPDTLSDERIGRVALRKVIREFFGDFTGELLFYFSGHGAITTEGAYLCTYDSEPDDWGIPMQEIVEIASKSPASQITLILDCCHSGNFANPELLRGRGGTNPIATIRENMTIIAASREVEAAIEVGGHGLFTAAILDALEGGAADLMGLVSAPAMYSYVERRFGALDQRPVYKSHTLSVPILRHCESLIETLKLRQLTHFFPDQHYKFQLDPEYEPEDEFGNMHEPINEKKVQTSNLFKEYRDAGLVKASQPNESFFWTARKGNTIELTRRGKEYWWLLFNNKI